jgi:putative FmdB family regulatory protein
MPTYEYACRSCGQHVEVAQSFTDPALTTCPHCGGELRKVFGNVGIVLKGSGFYKTDSRTATGKKGSAPKKIGDASSGSGESSNGSGGSESSSASAPSSSGSDSKSDAKSGSSDAKSGTPAGAATS